LEPFLNINREDSRSIESLIHFVLLELPFTYIFIDGLDETDYIEQQSLLSSYRQDDIPELISFIIKEAVDFPNKVRVWCSSQFSPRIQEYLCRSRKDAVVELHLQRKDTEDDIEQYLHSAIPGSTANGFVRILITAAMATEVEGSFLWASSMLADLKERAEDSDDMIKLASEGLPKKMNELYTRTISRIKQRDGGEKELPLWK
jgi:predicted RNA-binding protein YlqC (UPF0109 family)